LSLKHPFPKHKPSAVRKTLAVMCIFTLPKD
jgi:hypothetical protein